MSDVKPWDTNSIVDLIKEGDRSFDSTRLLGGIFGVAVPEASLYYEKALHLMSNDDKRIADTENSLGLYLGMTWKHGEAVPHLKKAYNLEPDNQFYAECLAIGYKMIKNYKDSSRMYREASKLLPKHKLRKYTNLAKSLFLRFKKQ